MPIQLIWEDEEKTILRHIYTGQVTAEEFHYAIEENYRLQELVDHPVDVISDMTTCKRIANVLVSSATRHAENKVPANQRLVVVAGADMYTRVILDTARRFARNTTNAMHIVKTVEEAFALIQKQRSRKTTS